MKQIFTVIAITSILSIQACNKGNVSSPSTSTDTQGYEVINRGSYNKMVKYGDTNNVLEEGYTVNGIKSGEWLSYDKLGNLITITSYMNGKINGPVITMNNRGQIEKMQYFEEDVAEGLYGEYKFGRAKKTANYTQGKLNGAYKEFYNAGKLQKEVTYKNGVQDGLMRYYSEEGEVTVEYMYKDGEKLSGGMIKK